VRAVAPHAPSALIAPERKAQRRGGASPLPCRSRTRHHAGVVTWPAVIGETRQTTARASRIRRQEV